MKPITVERLKEVVRHLPMGYYLGRQLPIIVEEGKGGKSELAFFDTIRCEIHLGINIINRALGSVDDMKVDWTEEKVIRTIVYHEVAHCLLSSSHLLKSVPGRLYSVPPLIKRAILNIFEDERIERLLSTLFLGVDFKGLCHAMNDVVDIKNKQIQKFFDAVRLGRATPEVLKKVNDAIVDTRNANAKTGLRNIYEDEKEDWDIIMVYSNRLNELYLSIMDMEPPKDDSNDESDDKGDDSDSGNGESGEDGDEGDDENNNNDGSGESGSDKEEEKNKGMSGGDNSEGGKEDEDEGDGGDGGDEEGDEESGDKDNGKEKGGGNEKEDEGESGEGDDKGDGDSDGDNDSGSNDDTGSNPDDSGVGDSSPGDGSDVNNEANEQRDGDTGEDDDVENGDDDAPPASPPEGLTEEDVKKLVNAMTDMYAPSAETQSVLKALSVRLSKKKGVQGCGRWSPMTGKLVPRRDALDMDRIFRKSSHEGERISSSVNLTLWIDKSGSFIESQNKINSIVKAAVMAEKMSGGHLHLNVCVMDTQCQVCEPYKMEVTCCGGNNINGHYEICFNNTRDKSRRNIDIVVFDGDALSDCDWSSKPKAYEIAEKIWNNRDTYIISDTDNEELFDNSCPKAIREYITGDYAEHLESTLVKVLNRIM